MKITRNQIHTLEGRIKLFIVIALVPKVLKLPST